MSDYRTREPIVPVEERLAEIYGTTRRDGPFSSYGQAFPTFCRIVDDVEDRHSGVPKLPAGMPGQARGIRLYPPSDEYEIFCHSPHVKAYGHKGHVSFFGSNGSIQVRAKKGGFIEFDLPGADGVSVSDLLSRNYL